MSVRLTEKEVMANNDNSDDDNDGDDIHDENNPYFVNSYSIPGGLISLFT